MRIVVLIADPQARTVLLHLIETGKAPPALDDQPDAPLSLPFFFPHSPASHSDALPTAGYPAESGRSICSEPLPTR
jgi:hypothetical protein